MPNERAILCGDAAPGSLPFPDPDAVRLHLWGQNRNVNLDVNDIEWPLLAQVTDPFRDLIEIATYVYCADQAVTRGGAGVDNLGSNWRRRLFFRIPVRLPEMWSSAPLRDALVATLGFLSDDDYVFEFTKLKRPPTGDKYLFSMAPKIDEVILFSGGLDSLSGAVHEAVVGGRRVALVRHRSTTKLETRHRRLRELLDAQCVHPPLHFTVNISKEERLSREYTQRSRSFLYVALGAAVADLMGLSRVRFYENGVVSFNLAPALQVVGSKATRTTHPRVLKGFAEILSAVASRQFTVENRFLWHTKADVVAAIKTAGCEDLINFSTSCTHTWESTLYHPHCGSCSQCIDRRFAVLAAEAREDEGIYAIDLITGERPEGESRTMLASYVENASQVARLSPAEFFGRFGEVFRTLRYIPEETPDSASQKLLALHQRHARQVNAVVDGAIGRHAKGLRERTLPASCLLRLVCDSVSAGGRSTPSVVLADLAPPAANAPALDDDGWYTHTRLAEAFGVDPEALRKRLDRFRRRSLDDAWIEVANPRHHEPQYRYRLGSVRRLLTALQTEALRPASVRQNKSRRRVQPRIDG